MDNYATHLPILEALAEAINPAKVLEIGGGQYSTALFLDKETFSGLKNLHTVEDNAEWRAALKAAHKDRRWKLLDALPDKLDGYDLIFVDNGQTDKARIATLEMLAQAGITGPIVLHDFEHVPYQQAAQPWDQWHIFTQHRPWTAILWRNEAAPFPLGEVVDNGDDGA
jgi:predicted O-methyltransferase YrrM